MSLRKRISDDLKRAMVADDRLRIATLRLITAMIRDRDSALRAEAEGTGMSDPEIVAVLARMAQMRRDSLRDHEEGGRLELAEREQAEVEVIEGYLPRPLDRDQIVAAVEAVVAELGASTIRDLGRVMDLLRMRHAGQMDVACAGPLVRARLTGGTEPPGQAGPSDPA
jgi:uncharacterized protein